MTASEVGVLGTNGRFHFRPLAGLGTLPSLAFGESGRSLGGPGHRRQPGEHQPFIEGIASGRYGRRLA